MKPYYQNQSPLDQGPPFWYSGRWVFAKGVLLVSCVGVLAGAAYLLLQETANDDRNTHSWGGSVSRYASGSRAAPVLAQTKPVASVPPDTSHATPAATTPRDQRRDSALHAAEQCATQGAWGCVLRRASEALAVDSGSQQAQSLLERAIVASAWKPVDLPKPGSPKLAQRAAPTGAAVPWSRGGTTVPLPSSLDWDAESSDASKRLRAYARPPLPVANSTAARARVDAKPASVAATAAPSADTAPAARKDSAADPQQRAIEQILQSGWKHPTQSDAAR